MDSWVINANDFDLKNIEEFLKKMLISNGDIKTFLSPHRTDRFLVLAPKGFGKTLLLKARRQVLQSHSELFLPRDSLLDKPPTIASVIGGIVDDEYGPVRSSADYWKSVWLMAFALTILKALKQRPFGIAESSPFRALLDESNPLEYASDIFDNLVGLSRGLYFDALNEYRPTIVPAFRNIRSSVALFIDNIDEGYDSYLAHRTKSGIAGSAERDHWYLAQVGAAQAAFELNSLNDHVRIHVAIRKEVRGHLERVPNGQKILGSILDLTYEKSELEEMIRKNIYNESKSRLASPGSSDPVARFFGHSDYRMVHPRTGDEESVIDFWIRHTLGRPRDVAAIGARISALPVNSRHRAKVREVVYDETRKIAATFLAEVEPHLDGFYPDELLRLIPSNVLSAEQVKDIAEKYSKLPIHVADPGTHDDDLTHDRAHFRHHPFCALFRTGLLGYVAVNPQTGQDEQIFCAVGELPLNGARQLPDAQQYLLHPVLDGRIGAVNPKYLATLDEMNVVGRGLPWRKHRDISYIAMGDVEGSSRIKRQPVESEKFSIFLNGVVAQARIAYGLRHATVSNGDSVSLVDDNPRELVSAARYIENSLANSDFQSTGVHVRFGATAGFVDVETHTGSVSLHGGAVVVAARIQPHVKPGKIWVSQEFVDSNNRYHTKSGLKFTALMPDDVPHLQFKNGKVDISKPGSAHEEPILVTLYRVDVL